MIYETNYRSTRTASILASVILLLGVLVFLGFLFMQNTIKSDVEINWSMITIFIPVFVGAFIPIIAAISAQRRKREAGITFQNHHFEMKMKQQAQERARKQVDKDRRPSFVYCKYCGEKIVEDALFCPQCGTKMRI